MSVRLLYGWTACLVASLGVGCSTGPQSVRGQSPEAAAFGRPASVQRAGSVPPQQYAPVSHVPGAGRRPAAGLSPHGFAGGGRFHGATGTGRNWSPTHSHWFDYERPRNLVYPPANQPAGVVAYPYYTLRGPTDFFLE